MANRNADQQQCIVKIILFVIWKKQRNWKRKELEKKDALKSRPVDDRDARTLTKPTAYCDMDDTSFGNQ